MQPPMLNGVVKPADAIARGTHVYDEPTRKYKEVEQKFQEFPRVMYHETEGEKNALDQNHMLSLESAGWRTIPFPPKPAKETVTAAPADLAMIVLQQQQELKAMHEQLQSMMDAKADEPKRGPGRPRKEELTEA